MVCHYVAGYGGSADLELNKINIQWPGKNEKESYSFPGRNPTPNAELLSLEHPKIRGLLARLPRVAKGMPLSHVRLYNIPDGISGSWSLWEIRLRTDATSRTRISPVFVHQDGRCLQPTARFLFEQLMVEPWTCDGLLDSEKSEDVFNQSYGAATDQLKDIYLDLRRRHLNSIALEEEKGEYSFRVRRKLLEGIGLPEVRNFRLRQLGRDYVAWQTKMQDQRSILPELNPILILRVN